MSEPEGRGGAAASPDSPSRPPDVLAPVLAIDGPTASGKGTIAQRVAAELGWHYLDSGALYRLAAVAALRTRIGATDVAQCDPALVESIPPGELVQRARAMQLRFEGASVFLDGEDVSAAIRSEAAGSAASRIATLPALREALVGLQRGFRQPPGLVADGRDMGTVIFPDATLKVFLTASAEARAGRRHRQLAERGVAADFDALLRDLQARDARDMGRVAAPLRPAEDARVLDCTAMGIDETVKRVVSLWRENA